MVDSFAVMNLLYLNLIDDLKFSTPAAPASRRHFARLKIARPSCTAAKLLAARAVLP
jgi:hypothetical protein